MIKKGTIDGSHVAIRADALDNTRLWIPDMPLQVI